MSGAYSCGCEYMYLLVVCREYMMAGWQTQILRSFFHVYESLQGLCSKSFRGQVAYHPVDTKLLGSWSKV